MSRAIIIIICFLLSLLWGWSKVLPKYQDWRAVLEDIKEKNTELRFREAYFSELEKTFQELEKYQLALSKIDSALPDFAFLPPIYDCLQTEAARSGLVLKEIKLGLAPRVEEERIGKIGGILKVSGSYSAFKNFLQNLEKNSRIFEVETISFASPRGPEEPFSFSLTITTHSY